MARFADVLGHEQTITHLKHAIQFHKVSHAYIINGEKGSGKKLLAGIFAQTLQCKKGGLEPCMECQSCKQSVSQNQPDIIRITHEKPGTISSSSMEIFLSSLIAAFIKSILLTRQRNLRFRHRMRCLRR